MLANSNFSEGQSWKEHYAEGQSWKEHYAKVYQTQMASSRPLKTLVYRYGDNTGWGNRIRGTYSAFFLAILSNRVFQIEHVDHEVHFDAPEGWVLFSKDLKSRTDYQRVHTLKHGDDAEQFEVLKKIDPERFFSLSTLIFEHGVSIDYCLFENPLLTKRLQNMFGSLSRIIMVSELVSFVLSNHRPALLKLVEEFKQRMKWDENLDIITIQLRLFVDVRDGLQQRLDSVPSLINSYENYVKNFTSEYGSPAMLRLFVTSDHEDSVVKITSALSSRTGVGALENVGAAGHTSLLPNGNVKDPIVEWFLIGESKCVISSSYS